MIDKSCIKDLEGSVQDSLDLISKLENMLDGDKDRRDMYATDARHEMEGVLEQLEYIRGLLLSPKEYQVEPLWFCVCLAQKMISEGIDSVPKEIVGMADAFIDNLHLTERYYTPHWSFWMRVTNIYFCKSDDQVQKYLDWWKEKDEVISRAALERLRNPRPTMRGYA